jgi:hypothetical protein
LRILNCKLSVAQRSNSRTLRVRRTRCNSLLGCSRPVLADHVLQNLCRETICKWTMKGRRRHHGKETGGCGCRTSCNTFSLFLISCLSEKTKQCPLDLFPLPHFQKW